MPYPAQLRFTSIAKINTLYWISSLDEDEQGVTRRILEDLEPLCAAKNLRFRRYAPTGAAELLAALDDIAAEARDGMLPLVHFDMHGSAPAGLRLSPSEEFVDWAAVADRLRVVNETTGNNLCVVSGACFSFEVVRQIDIHRTVPFFILLAPEEEISSGELEERTAGFYRDMLDEEDILTARERWFGDRLRLFHCEKMLAVVLAKYVNNAAMGRQQERRREQLVTDAINQGVVNDRGNRRRLRRMANEMIKPTEELIKRFVPVFLAGKEPGFTIDEIKRMVREARSAGLSPEGPYA